MKITNTQPGPRGLNTINGPVLLDVGQTLDDVKVYARERQHIEAAGWFNVEGEYTADPVVPGAPAAASVDTSEIDRLNAEIERLKALVPAAPLKAEHHGGGKFNITQGETVLSSGLSKADADAFNAMSDGEKAEFVKASKSD